MKHPHIIYPLTAATFGLLATLSTMQAREATIALHSHWKHLGSNSETDMLCGGKLIDIGTIVITRRSQTSTTLDKLELNWHGPHLKHLSASLYHKTPYDRCLAIDRDHLCDGTWNEQKQMLTLPFDEQQRLAAKEEFHLVLIVPPELERPLHTGHFELAQTAHMVPAAA